MPLDVVVEFKRGVYEMALTELARFLPRQEYRNRYLRGGTRPREDGLPGPIQTQGRRAPMAFELPPDASLDALPQRSFLGRDPS